MTTDKLEIQYQVKKKPWFIVALCLGHVSVWLGADPGKVAHLIHKTSVRVKQVPS